MKEEQGEEESLAAWACAAGSATTERSRAVRTRDLVLLDCNAISLSRSVVRLNRKPREEQRRRTRHLKASCWFGLHWRQSQHIVCRSPCRSQEAPDRRKVVAFPTAAFPCGCRRREISRRKQWPQ